MSCRLPFFSEKEQVIPFRRLRRGTVWLGLLVLLVLLSSCGAPKTGLRIMLMLREGFPRNALYTQTIQMAIADDINQGGQRVRPELLLFTYDAADPELSTKYGAFIDKERPTISMGTVFSSDVRLLSDAIAASKVPHITLGTATELTNAGNPYLLRASASDSTMCRVAVKYIVEVLKAKRIGIIHAEGVYGEGAYRDIAAALARYDLSLTEAISYKVDVQPETMVENFRRVNEENLDVCILWADYNQQALFLNAMMEEPLRMTYVCNEAFRYLDGENLAQAHQDGNYVLTNFLTLPEHTSFTTSLKERYGVTLAYNESPHSIYDIANHILKAARTVHGELTPDTLQASLRAEPYKGLVALYHYQPNGEGVFQVFIGEIRKGLLVFRKIEVLEE